LASFNLRFELGFTGVVVVSAIFAQLTNCFNFRVFVVNLSLIFTRLVQFGYCSLE